MCTYTGVCGRAIENTTLAVKHLDNTYGGDGAGREPALAV